MAQPPYPAGGFPDPNAGYPPQQPGYPPQQSGFAPQQPGYPPQQPGYPPQQPGYPPQQPGYPPQQPGYPPQQPGYSSQQPGYPPQQPGYPPQQPGYPPQQPGYPQQQPGYPPQQPGYPQQQPGYPQQQPQQQGYPVQTQGYPQGPQASGGATPGATPGFNQHYGHYGMAPAAPPGQGYMVAQPQPAPLPSSYTPSPAYSGHGLYNPANIKNIQAKGSNAGNVILNFSCKGLRDRDVLSKSDPQVILYTSVKDRANYTLTGRTERVKNNLSPVFGTGIEVPYIFERQTFCKVVVVDDDGDGISSAADNLGEAEFTLGQAVSKKTLQLELTHRRWGPKGSAIISASHSTTTKEVVTLQFEGGHLDKKDTFGKSDPYFEIFRMTGGTEALVKRSETLYNTLNPKWMPVVMTSTQLCNNDETAKIKIKVYDWDENSSNDLIGECVTTLAEMKKTKKEIVQFDLINHHKQSKKKSYKNSGVLKVLQCSSIKSWSFLDYVSAGLQLNCMVAFDFTASNGHPNSPDSLHHLNSQGVNQYTMAWSAIGQIIQDYDWDKLFPAYGFGGALPPNNQVSFEFALNANPQDPNCAGIEGVIQAYQTALQNVALSGPTNCAPILRTATRYANACAVTPGGGQGYLILMLMTDGKFTDLQACIQAIQQAQNCPLSIIIVGVGNADFGDMELLDGDRGSVGKKGRDIVQFVPFNKYAHSPPLLARELLAELPGQVEKYFMARKQAPIGKKMH